MMTLAKIAKEIGVGKSTVSLVLNGRAKEMRISDNTVRRVRDYCEKMNYLPNIHARRMCQDVVKSIMVFLNVHNAFLSESSFADYNVNLIMGGITESLVINGRIMNELNLSCDPAATAAVLGAQCPVTAATAQAASAPAADGGIYGRGGAPSSTRK